LCDVAYEGDLPRWAHRDAGEEPDADLDAVG
jgi:hypothetical protein